MNLEQRKRIEDAARAFGCRVPNPDRPTSDERTLKAQTAFRDALDAAMDAPLPVVGVLPEIVNDERFLLPEIVAIVQPFVQYPIHNIRIDEDVLNPTVDVIGVIQSLDRGDMGETSYAEIGFALGRYSCQHSRVPLPVDGVLRLGRPGGIDPAETATPSPDGEGE